MKRIFVIEPSLTLRQALRHLIGHLYEIVLVNDYAEGLDLLRKEAGQVDMVVLGSWSPVHAGATETLSLLGSRTWSMCPVVLLTQGDDTASSRWLKQRRRGIALPWSEYEHLPAKMEALFENGEMLPATTARVSPGNVDQVRILLVDDSSASRFAYCKMLEGAGYHVDTASGGRDALDKLEKLTVDIAIIDYFMPDMNGDELCRKITDNPRTQEIHSAILTATYLDQVISSALAAGAVDCLFKTEADALFLARVEAISRLIRGRKQEEAERQRFESILTSVGSGVFGIDQNGLITFVNPAARQILGLVQSANLSGQTPEALFYRENAILMKAGGNGALPYGVMQRGVFCRSDGAEVPVEYSVYPLIIQGGSEGFVVSFKDMSDQYKLEAKLRWQAAHDPLTGLSNRRYFEEEMDREMARLKRTGQHNALLYIDLDQFKYINDTLGHNAGDELLIEVARQLTSRLRESDFIARLGGDEFAVILKNISADAVFEVADHLRDMLHQCNFAHEGKNYKINGSIGAVVYTAENESVSDVLACADIACHIAKRKGRNQTHVYSEEDDEKSLMGADFGWSMRLREALQKNLFVLGFQPILALQELPKESLGMDVNQLWQQHRDKNNALEHYEVLVRLKDRDGSLIPANVFMSPAERFNLLHEIDLHVLSRALRLLAAFKHKGRHVVFSINLSGNTMASEGLTELVLRLFEQYRVDPKSVIFEITERVAIDNLETAKHMMAVLQQHGCRFALDDFGTGFSSFSHLKNLPVDFIKIDGSFIQDISTDPVDRTLVASINEIAHSLGRKTVAEYVGSKEILSILHDCGVDYVQGNFISSPLTDIGGAHSENPVADLGQYRHRVARA